MNTTAILGFQLFVNTLSVSSSRPGFLDRLGTQKNAMPSAVSQPQAASWLVENGPKELELLFRAIVYHPSAPILIADHDRHYRDASSDSGKLLGLSRDKIIGRSLDDFVEPSFKPQISGLWQAFLQ